MSIPGLNEANRIMSDLKRLGIRDVELMYDAQVHLWGVVQVFKPSGMILLMDDPRYYETGPSLMFWIRNDDMTYRNPGFKDLSDIISIVKRAQTWFDKGSDFMINEMEREEQKKYDKQRQEQSEKIRSYAKPLKKAIKKELS